MGILYFLIAIIATTLGALAGLGGGVIIKPLLDTLGQYNLASVSLLSSFTVFSMAIVSTFKQWRAGFKFKLNTVILSVGAILGGILGEFLFTKFKNMLPEMTAKGIQAIILGILLIIVIFRDKLPKSNISNIFPTFAIGLFLGTVSSFLGIGGGPINLAFLTVFLGMDIKEAAVNSIFIILLAQASKLGNVMIKTGFSPYDLEMLWFMIPASILGGLIGSKLNRKLNGTTINKIFITVVSLIIILNFYNAFRFLT